jgi:hypothetical protein
MPDKVDILETYGRICWRKSEQAVDLRRYQGAILFFRYDSIDSLYDALHVSMCFQVMDIEAGE